jgi:hypothetical protein
MLSQLHEQIDGHFRELSRQRASVGYPVYAFEHNLEPPEVDALRTALCDDLVRTSRLNRLHWLLWTTVAAEIGYTYDGEEYWQSFKADIPPWVSSIPNRELIREWFQEFSRRFNGFQPTGRWADHFSIIAWPITHSILPRYLHSHFAKHLYDLRHELAAKQGTTVEQLGQLLEVGYHGYSSRFENFLQQRALTARLVLALRDEDVQDKVSPIYRPTLARIVRDLEQKGSSRGYLRDARRILRDARLHVRQGLTGYSRPESGDARTRHVETTIPPGLKLHARRAQDDAWMIGMALPNFSVLAAQAGVEPTYLNGARVRFSDRPDGWMPGRALQSYSDSSHWLSQMPNSLDDPVILFREPDDHLKSLMAQLKILSRSPWLLRICGDGVARQVLGNHVRTSEDYLIATSSAVTPDLKSALSLVDAVCKTQGIILYRLHVPAQVTPQFIKGLQTLTLGYSLRAHVRPFGLVARWDEANACSIWLSSEDLILHLSADFPVNEFGVSIDGDAKTRVPMTESQEVLVSVGTLPLGQHVIEISATPKETYTSKGEALRQITPERIVVEVRAASSWTNVGQTKTGIRLNIEPPNASFDDMVERRVAFSLHGPASRTAMVLARLYNVTGQVTETDELGRISIPAPEGAIARLIEKLSREPLSEKIQVSARVDLTFAVDELGLATVSFPRKIAPLRWKLSRTHDGSTVRLVDETGAPASISVSRYDLATPDARRDLAVDASLQGIAVAAPGSLFVARLEEKRFAALASVPPSGRLTDFSALRTAITLSVPATSPRAILRLLALLRIWRLAQPLGPLAAVRKAEVLDLFETQIEMLACGRNWTEKAHRYRKSGVPFEQLQRDVGGSPGFASRMRTTDWTWHVDSGLAKQAFFRLAKTYDVCGDKHLCNLALTLAFHPASIRLNDPKQGARDFETLANTPNLARGAYFAKMTSDLRFAQPKTAERAAE